MTSSGKALGCASMETPPLSCRFHRSLAALAGERDRALRSLAAEEDKRRDVVEAISSLLGGELSCADVSRLTMGLERIEQEEGREGGEEPNGRVWVLEVRCCSSRCLVNNNFLLKGQGVSLSWVLVFLLFCPQIYICKFHLFFIQKQLFER